MVVFQRLLPHYRSGIFETIAASEAYDYTFCFGDGGDSASIQLVSGKPTFPARFVPMWRWRPPGTKHPLYFQWAEIQAALSREFDVLIFSSDLHMVSFIAGSLLARLRCKKVVHWGHGLPKGLPRRNLRWWVYRQVMRLANAVLLYGKREYDAFVRLGVNPGNLFCAYNALDTRQARALRASIADEELRQFRRDHGLDGRRVLIYTGRLVAAKKIHQLIAAMPLILKEISEAKLVLIGDGPEAGRLSAQVEELGLANAVSMPGGVHEEAQLARYYLCSDLAVSAGYVGLMVNHAFMYGVPVLTNDDLWSHSPEIAMIEPGATGEFFIAGDLVSLAEHAVELLRDRAKLAAMRTRCLRLIDEEYNEQIMATCFDDAVRYALAH